MKNMKQKLTATLAVLTIAFSGSAFADGKHSHGMKAKQSIAKAHTSKHVKQGVVKKTKTVRFVNQRQVKKVKTVVVKNGHNKKRITTVKTIVKKPVHRQVAHSRFISDRNKRWNRGHQRFVKWNKGHKRYYKSPRRVVYSIRAGDTLIRISLKTGISVKKLARLNRLNHGRANTLQIGQLLRLS